MSQFPSIKFTLSFIKSFQLFFILVFHITDIAAWNCFEGNFFEFFLFAE
jgi:hypothetical protein